MPTSTSIIEVRKKSKMALFLQRILCTYYPPRFGKNQAKIKALIDSNSEINVMFPAYTAKSGLKIWSINFVAQKIDGFILKMFCIMLASF